MPEYLLTARDEGGRKDTHRVEAPSADAAVRRLRKRGYTEIVLHTDDVGALYSNQADVDAHISPSEYVALRHAKGYLGRARFFLVKFYRDSWKLYACLLGLLALRVALRATWEAFAWGFFDYLLLALLALPGVMALALAAFNAGTGAYDRVLEASAWGRWEDMLLWLPDVGHQIPPEEYAFRRAQALAGTGRLEQALKEVEPFRHDESIPEWIYWGRLVDLYGAARQIEPIVPCMERAAELAPDNATVLLDLALVLLRYRRDAGRARVLLERVSEHAISDVLAPVARMAEGMLALEEGSPANAEHDLRQAMAELDKFRNASPLIGTLIDNIYTYLALTRAARGDRAGALEHYRQAEPRLHALNAHDLIERCEAALDTETA